MGIVSFVSDMIIPIVVSVMIIFGMKKKISVYDTFLEGATDGLKITVKILPTLIGLMVAVGILRESGFLTFLSELLSPAANVVGFPKEAVPLSFMRLVSSSASTGLLLDIFKNYGPDSFIGRFVSVMMSCTETVFYTMSVYFLSVNVTKTRYTLAGALIANAVGLAGALVITIVTFGK
ncbi:MAG: spore maturation protein [Clostridiales bacterium]|nr:spore maturation protein [Clostridiales bacterium]